MWSSEVHLHFSRAANRSTASVTATVGARTAEADEAFPVPHQNPRRRLRRFPLRPVCGGQVKPLARKSELDEKRARLLLDRL
jgi:hypothetical protein